MTADVVRYVLIVGAGVALLATSVIVATVSAFGMSRYQACRFIGIAFALASVIVGSVRFLGAGVNYNLLLNVPFVGFTLYGLWAPLRSRLMRKHILSTSPEE